jgi:hypothetical protein
MEVARHRARWQHWGLAVRDLAARIPMALAVFVVLGIQLRIALWLAYEPATMNLADTLAYVGMADGEMFSDPSRTAGYSMFLRGLHLVSAQLEWTILVQHLLGLATAILFYAAFRRLDAPRWAAAVGAGGVLLSLDQIVLEHTLMAETPFTFLLALALYLGVRTLDEPRDVWRSITTRHAWIAAAALTFGLLAWIRPVMVPALPLLVLWFAFATPGTWRVRLARGAVAALAASTALVAYAGIQAAHNGFFGLTPSSGWAFYARTAPFADCSKFDPPAGTEALCESTPPAERLGPDWYAWEPGSPAQREFGGQPNGSDELNAFARAAILGQPLDYLEAVGTDSLRYFRPSLGDPPSFSGVGGEVLDIERRSPGVEETVNEEINSYYADERLEIDGSVAQIGKLQDVLRMNPVPMTVVALLSVLALTLARGRLRAGLVLMVGTSAALLVIPPATAVWGARYAVPVTGPLVGSAAIGVWLAIRRVRARRGGAPEDEPAVAT